MFTRQQFEDAALDKAEEAKGEIFRLIMGGYDKMTPSEHMKYSHAEGVNLPTRLAQLLLVASLDKVACYFITENLRRRVPSIKTILKRNKGPKHDV